MQTVRLLQNNEDSVVIGFEGRLSVDNAAEAEKELFRIREENTQGTMVFDFDKLEYISSSGLRVLLKATQNERGKKIKIINAP